jgi:hypothetical protein
MIAPNSTIVNHCSFFFLLSHENEHMSLFSNALFRVEGVLFSECVQRQLSFGLGHHYDLSSLRSHVAGRKMLSVRLQRRMRRRRLVAAGSPLFWSPALFRCHSRQHPASDAAVSERSTRLSRGRFRLSKRLEIVLK